MREALHAVAEELRRLKGAGVGTVAVSDETLAAVRRVVKARSAPASTAVAEPASDRKSTRLNSSH